MLDRHVQAVRRHRPAWNILAELRWSSADQFTGFDGSIGDKGEHGSQYDEAVRQRPRGSGLPLTALSETALRAASGPRSGTEIGACRRGANGRARVLPRVGGWPEGPG
ncbi:hypothetical protein Vwe01_17720 [Micromonospora andamanensis]|nr:hypothetical protein Vwe01_17720 [Micromonospora andamanensis]